jgi:hypothetical protein
MAITVNLNNVERMKNSKVILSTAAIAGQLATEVLIHVRRNMHDAARPAKVGMFIANSVTSSVAGTAQSNVRKVLEPNERKTLDATIGLIGVGSGIVQAVSGARNGSNKQVVYGATRAVFGGIAVGGVLGRLSAERGNDSLVFTWKPDPRELSYKLENVKETVAAKVDAAKELLRRA